MAIDVVGYLESRGIDLKYSGEQNVGPNDVAINCLWCDDPSFHLTINKKSGKINCWRCDFADYRERHPKKWRPSFKNVIREIEKCSWDRVKEIWEDIGGDIPEETVHVTGITCEMPGEAISFYKPGPFEGARDYAYDYLKRRGFNKYHIRTFDLKFCPTGEYKNRIIIPVYHQGELVNWIGRNYGPTGIRYKNCPLPKCKMRVSQLLFGSELVKDYRLPVLRLVEGYFDMMALGKNALGMGRSNFSKTQRNILVWLLKTYQPKYLSLIMDKGSEYKGSEIADEISPFFPYIKNIWLADERDPADLGLLEIERIEANTKFHIS
jgi:hypothetical protein